MSRLVSFGFVVAGIIVGTLMSLYSENFDLSVSRLSNSMWDYINNIEPMNRPRLYTQEDLARYNGDVLHRLYLSYMGTVFDVTGGYKHYGGGSPYHYFVGKDGTRAFVTGDFNDESKDKDHILDLNCAEILSLWNWRSVLNNKYKRIGFLIGRYYDREGMETEYLTRVFAKVSVCKENRLNEREEEKRYPPCNISWSPEEGTRVWCTKLSGGVGRDWSGVPRQMYTPGMKEPRCVCVQTTEEDNLSMFKVYENCANTSSLCSIEVDNYNENKKE